MGDPIEPFKNMIEINWNKIKKTLDTYAMSYTIVFKVESFAPC